MNSYDRRRHKRKRRFLSTKETLLTRASARRRHLPRRRRRHEDPSLPSTRSLSHPRICNHPAATASLPLPPFVPISAIRRRNEALNPANATTNTQTRAAESATTSQRRRCHFRRQQQRHVRRHLPPQRSQMMKIHHRTLPHQRWRRL